MALPSSKVLTGHEGANGSLPESGRRLPLIPASYFGIVLGLGGLATSWRVAHAAWAAPAAIGDGLFVVAGAAWFVVTGLYIWKWVVAVEVALAEAGHPVQCCFIGLGGVATLVMAQGALPFSRSVAELLFVIGATFTLGFGLWRTGLLWQGQRETEATTPILLLPVVAGGFVTATVTGALGWHDWAALAFGGAFFSWLAIESVVLHRLYTATTLPPALRPTLGIQLAPPAVGALAYLATGSDPSSLIPKALVGYALLQAMLLVRMWRWIAVQPFAPSYWAITFGVTALPAALIKISMSSTTHAFADIALPLFVVSNLVVAIIAFRTVGLFLRPLQG
jgi:tellurite resistance protein